MPVTDLLMGPGQWSVTLSVDTPRQLLDSIQTAYWGHIAISSGWNDPRVAGDTLLTSARYVGPMTGVSLIEGTGYQLTGSGMWTWLSGPNNIGSTAYETAVTLAGSSFVQGVKALLAPIAAVKTGNLTNPTSATITQTYQFTDPGTALTSFCSLADPVGSGTGAVVRVNGDASVDAGPVSSLFVTSPTALVVSQEWGRDMNVFGIQTTGNSLNEDMTQWSTRVVLLGYANGTTVSSGVANLSDIGASNPYKDLFGNPVARVRTASDSTTSSNSVLSQAEAILTQYSQPVDQVLLSSSEYDISGTFRTGDYVWVYDPATDLVDLANEIYYHGRPIQPVQLQVTQTDWPIKSGMGVAFRDNSGNWYDLTQYVVWENDQETNITVGGNNVPLVGTDEQVPIRFGNGGTVTPEVPGVPAFTGFATASYQSSSDGSTKAQIQASWTVPTNTDSSTIVNGDHYEIQYRPSLGLYRANPSYTQLALAGYTYNSLAAQGGSYNSLIPTTVANWKVTYVPWGTNTVIIQELTAGVEYDFEIRAVNSAIPPVPGAFSATTTVQASQDVIPPPTPDPPTVAANLLAVQVTWDCGQASGGSFNQAVDLNHVEVHASLDPLFTPVPGTKLGNLQANISNIVGQIPVVGSFTIPPNQPPAQNMYVRVIAVDNSGNKSNPSASVGATALLVADQYITSLTASKITAGQITSQITISGTLATSLTGVRAGLDSTGLWCYDSTGDQTFFANAATGTVTLSTHGSGQRLALDTGFNLTPYGVPLTSVDAIVMYADATSTPAVIACYENTTPGAGGTWEISAAWTALNSSQGAWGVASDYAPVLSLQADGPATMAYVDVTSGNFSGGAFQAVPNLAFMGLANEAAIGGGILINTNAVSATETLLEFLGYIADAGRISPNPVDTLFPGQLNGIGAGSKSVTWSYGSTMTSQPAPMATSSCGTTTSVPAGTISALSTTGSTWTASATFPATWSLFFQGMRVR